MSHDYVIVGGGSAGATLAARLSERPGRTVLLLEAGADGPLGTADDRVTNVSFAATPRDWGMRASVTPAREVEYPQGRFVGGGSSVNGALAFRGTPSDYDGWAAAGNPSWSYEHLLPCLRRLEDDRDFGADAGVHGRGGPIPIVRWGEDELVPLQEAFRAGCETTGAPWCPDLNRPGTEGVGPLPMNRDGDVRVSTALAYLAPARGRPNLEVRGDAHVARVCIDSGRAVAVELQTDAGTERIEAGTVVLSAGSILTPGLLWRSGIGPGDALRALGIEPVVDNPAVGANLTDHPGTFLFARPATDDLGPTDPQYQLAARASSSSGTADDLFVSMMNVFDLAAMPDLQSAIGAPTAVVLTCGVHEPRSRGRVTLESADPRAAPRVELGLLSEHADAARLVEGIRRCREVARAGMSKYVGSIALLDDDDFADDARLEAYARSVVAPWYHPVGTCRMGPAGSGAVVGDDLTVHGVDGLRVVDASVMPVITRAPTNITTIAIAERAAELIN